MTQDRYAFLQTKADKLLAQGDRIGGAQGRQLLRECRRVRLQAKRVKEARQ